MRHRITVSVDVNGKMERYAFNIKLGSIIDFNRLDRYFNGDFAEPPHECLQVLDILLRYAPSYIGTPINQSIYVPEACDKFRQSIGNGQSLAFGFYQSVHPVLQGKLTCCFIKTFIFFYSCVIFQALVWLLIEPPPFSTTVAHF